jgi:hypothetical protein
MLAQAELGFPRSPRQQALLILVHLRKCDAFAARAAGFDVGPATGGM